MIFLYEKLRGKISYWNKVLYDDLYRLVPVKKLAQHDNDTKVIVSLTSFPQRLETLDICLKSLLRQTVQPDKIIVTFGDDVQEKMIPPRLKKMQKYGIEFKFYEENLKPHKKYFYTMQDYKESIIITVDDDSIYPMTTLQELITSYKKYPNSISARRVHKIRFDKGGKIAPYSMWEKETKVYTEPSKELVAIGVGGILYPPGIMPSMTYNKKMIKSCALCADDLWLKAMEISAGLDVVWAVCEQPEPDVIVRTQRVRLNKVNTGEEGGNDKALKEIMVLVGLDNSDFKEQA